MAAQTISFYGFIITSTFGFIGHACSLLTFSSKTLRTTSTGLLFIMLTISDIVYLLIYIQDFLTQTLQIPILQSEDLCRFRTFVLNFAVFTSSWLLVVISIDRMIRACFPYQMARLCTQKTASYAVVVVYLCGMLNTGHVLQPAFGYTFLSRNICGPARTPVTYYSTFYFDIWPILQLLMTYTIPTCIMFSCGVAIYRKIHTQRTNVAISTRREKLQRQMLILMLSTVACFIICTVPYSIHRIYYLQVGITSDILTQISAFTVILNINYAYNFYMNCLTSQFFRKKFIERVERLYGWYKRRRARITNVIVPITNNDGRNNVTMPVQ